MRYHVRNEHGELEVPSYAMLRSLYFRSFISDEDEVRKEGSDRWVKAGNMQDLRAIKPKHWFEGYEFAWLSVAICVGTLLMVLFMHHHK